MNPAYAQKYAAYEESHWWFRARRIILADLLRREIDWKPGLDVLEVGVGPGLNLYSLYPSTSRLRGMEPDVENAKIAAGRGPVPVAVGTVEAMPDELANQRYDLITLFDVLEHIENDLEALRRLRGLLRDGGALVLTVPAHAWLWSRHDVMNQHFRRYSRTGLENVLRAAGFHIQRLGFFNSFLLPLVAGARWLGRWRKESTAEAETDFDQSAGWLDPLFFQIFSAERHWLRHASFPSGVSLFAVARISLNS